MYDIQMLALIRKRMNRTIYHIIKSILFACLIIAVYSFETDIDKKSISDSLNLIITINGILIAIISTFLFSKILTERAERIQKKIEIDKLSNKVTSLRKVSRLLFESRDFWIKPTHTIHENYPDIDIFTLRQFNYDQLSEFLERTNMGELNSQAYLSNVYIAGEDERQLLLNQNYRKNYNLKTLSEYHECCSFIYSYCEEYNQHISIENWELERITEDIIKISPTSNNITPKKIGEIYSNFATRDIEKLYQLTVENNKNIGSVFKWIFINILVSLVLLLIAIIGLVYTQIPSYLANFTIIGTIWIISDLILNTYYSMFKEIKIEEFYQ